MNFAVSSVVIPLLLATVAGWIAHEAFIRWRYRREMDRISALYDPWEP